MKIQEVMRLTGLTRKAIYFYEKEGLIRPRIDETNQYRDYSDADVDRLRLIAALRSLDFSVQEIKRLLDGQETPIELVRRRLAGIRQQKEQLDRAERVLAALCEEPLESGELLRRLRAEGASYDQSRRLDADYLAGRLLELFPGAFGRLLSLHFGAFLDEPLDSPAKEQAWRELVDYLDAAGEFELPPVLKELDALTESDFEHIRMASLEHLRPYLNPDDETYGRLLAQARAALNSVPFQAYNRSQAEFMAPLKRELAAKGFYEGVVSRLEVLSSSYRAYRDTLRRLQDDLGIDYGEQGLIVF
ncbi:MerR family transcriptional regulator [Paenibacillus thermoaerophilus]|uniref:MerR family transcriptional regulator n=1 Tax=Paenibacillus thermoaerophilus TaxID=1215385 RepID=A0ABW2V6B3_9BACL|nr:MerR family transcriptional regulator [Paenibacillus thermoaerophilus]TMV13911.1 MerR family transcriptional regulator [Paenibacillus thermoaerophilus]